MTLNIQSLLTNSVGKNYELHDTHINPRFAKTLRTIGFDRCYTRAEGQYLWDNNGNRYLDMLSGYGVFNIGRNNPDIRKALIDFLNTNYPSLVQMDAPLLSGLLAKELKRRMPNTLDYVYFTNSGTEGVETAIKFARCATRRPAILFANKAFHGLTNGALALSGDDVFKYGFGPLLPECRMIPFNDLEALERALSDRDIAAFIVEPIQGKGVNIPDPGYLKEAAQLCRQHKTLFIADEVRCFAPLPVHLHKDTFIGGNGFGSHREGQFVSLTLLRGQPLPDVRVVDVLLTVEFDKEARETFRRLRGIPTGFRVLPRRVPPIETAIHRIRFEAAVEHFRDLVAT